MKLWQRWKQTAIHNKALVITSVLVAFGTLFYAVAAIVQVSIMRASSRQTAQQTQKLIDAANIQACAASKNADAANRNANAAEQFSRAAADQAKAAGISNLQSLRFFAEGNRPWIFVQPKDREKGEAPVVIQPGATLKLPFVVMNIGRTPAIAVTDAVQYAKIFTSGREEHDFLAKSVFAIPANDPRNGIMTPNTPFVIYPEVDHPLTVAESAGLLRTPQFAHLVVCGRIEYGSPLASTKPGTMYTEFCYRFAGGVTPQGSEWVPAKFHNDMK